MSLSHRISRLERRGGRVGPWPGQTRVTRSARSRSQLAYDEAVEEALCFGWVDSTAGTLDDERTLLWFAPRTPRSGWSNLNKERVARLMVAGLMAPAGLAKIEAAKPTSAPIIGIGRSLRLIRRRGHAPGGGAPGECSPLRR